jgi:hypothetical protein
LQLHFCAAYNKEQTGAPMLLTLLLMLMMMMLMTGLPSQSHVPSTVSPLQRE